MKAWLKVGLIGLKIAGILILISMILDFIITCHFGTEEEFCGFFTLLSILPILIICLVIGLIIGIQTKKK